MTIGIDMDSVLAYLEVPLINFHNETYGTKHVVEDLRAYDLSIPWNCTRKEAVERVYEFYRSPFMDIVEPVKGSVEAVDMLLKNHELVIVTSRPHWVEDKTHAWFEKYFPNKFKSIVHTNQASHEGDKSVKKSEICLNLGAKVFIDDNIDYCTDCAENGIQTYLYDRPWNAGNNLHKNISRVLSWDELTKKLS